MSVQQISDGARQLSDAAKIKLLEWRMALAWFFFFTIVSLASALTAAMTNADWHQMDGQAVFLMCMNVIVSWGTTMMAFFSKAAKKVEQQLIPDNGNTAQFVRQPGPPNPALPPVPPANGPVT